MCNAVCIAVFSLSLWPKVVGTVVEHQPLRYIEDGPINQMSSHIPIPRDGFQLRRDAEVQPS